MTIRLLMIHAAKKDARPGSELGGVAAACIAIAAVWTGQRALSVIETL